MRPANENLRVTVEDLEDPTAYETHRSDALVQMARYKAARRVSLADDVGILFEDRRTLRHQVQEMLRLESDTAEHVFRYYDELQPGPYRLVATLFVEVRRQEDIKPRLRHYARLERHIALRIDGATIRATPMGDHGDDEAATAVTYLRFQVPQAAWPQLAEAEIVVDHPNLRTAIMLPAAVARDPYGTA